MEKRITIICGDGIGPEIVEQAVAVLEQVGRKFGHRFAYLMYYKIGAKLCQPLTPGSSVNLL